MIGFRYDDGGREAAGFKGRAGDCVTRAIAIASGADYREVYKAAAKLNADRGRPRSARNGIHKQDRNTLAKMFGLEKVKLPRGPRPTYSEAYERYGNVMVSTTKHVCSIIDGELRDIFDGRVYYWETGELDEETGQPVVETRHRKAMSVYRAAV